MLQRVAATEFDRFLKYYENAEDLNIREQRRDPRERMQRDGFNRDDRGGRDDERGKRTERGGGRGERREFSGGAGNTARLFVNLGTKDGFYKASFLQFILDMSELTKDVLGRIDMKEMNSWIEIDSKAAPQMIRALDGKNYKGRRIRMNDANSR